MRILFCATLPADACAALDSRREQLHYARSTYTSEQLDRWQADWNRYFARYGMEIPAYAHKVATQAPGAEGALQA